MNAITYHLRLTEPLLATQVNSGEPNSAISFPYIPGSMIRGALIRRYLNEKSQSFDLASDADARCLFLDGDVQYLNAYPCHQGQRLLPKPFSWFVAKDDLENPQATFKDFAIVDPEQSNLEKPKSPRGDFVWTENGRIGLLSPKRQVNVHNFSDKPGDRRAGNSQVYRYDALAAGQTMAGAIVAADEADLSLLHSYLEEAVMVLGGSHTGGYGRVEMLSVETVTNWKEYKADGEPSDKRTLTFLSDAIIRTSDGHVSAALARLLSDDPKTVKAFQKVRVVGGFNRKWGLPLPQSWAIQAGSVFCLPDDVDVTTLENWVAYGVGERRAEGYGRIALNWHTKDKQQQTKLEATYAKPPKLSTKSKKIAQQMANRHLRAKLETELVKALNIDHVNFSGLPSPTQLSRVRLAARNALAQQNLSVIQEHMNSLTGAKSDWDKAKFKGSSLWEWIIEQSQKDESAFKQMFSVQDGLSRMAGVASALENETEVEFRARLIDGVMKLAVKASQKEEGGRS